MRDPLRAPRLLRDHRQLPDAFWRRIRNPHLFIFETDISEAGGAWRWRGERTFDGSPGVLAA